MNKKRIIITTAVLAILAVVFWWGGNAPGLQGWTVSEKAEPSSTTMDTGASASNDLSNDMHNEINQIYSEKGKPGGNLDDNSQSSNTTDSVKKQTHDTGIGPDTKLVEKSDSEYSNKPENNSGEKNSNKDEASTQSRPGGIEGGLSAQEKIELAKKIATGGSSTGVENGSADYSKNHGMVLDPNTGKDKYLTDPVPEGKPVPKEPQNAVITDKKLSCTLSVRCDTILHNIKWLNPEKVELVPEDGVILPVTTVSFYEGESVFNVLQREMKKAGIHMEFENTPMYNSAYIEGINNLYEFDCGELSGWMYKVNGWFPNYGCSRYQLKQGDVIEWVYTCDLGVDVGGFSAIGG